MQTDRFHMLGNDGKNIFVQEWAPETDSAPVKAVLQIAHGMCETGERYAELASLLTAHGYAVYVNDHRGHGQTAGRPEALGDAGENGFDRIIEDLLLLSEVIRDRHPHVPLFLLGHSMGSFLTQKIMCLTEGRRYDGFILSGSNGPRSMLSLGQRLASAQARMQGEIHRSLLMNTIVFGPYNKGFGMRTPFDWLSSDPEEVDRYMNDPYCGQICTTRFFRDFFTLLRQIHHSNLLKGLVTDKPIYIFSGEKDPVGMRGKGVRKLIQLYQERGVSDLEYRLYPDGRHEMLHEVNRHEVAGHILQWLDRQASRLIGDSPRMTS
ncbi:alpha/beta hydrolase [Paenibacillus lemnae]|uniref:Alpha/beta hydrolase n=1 Tax=Paenibacillus lemnae TaxID=1330551 RepID=A0A848M4T1_PAELE|nr:alpha/beta hydrolase [Paenibacillus lemnae]NMO96098.1 alpha/beta hydrolase [Paenibacillus lemnae]